MGSDNERIADIKREIYDNYVNKILNLIKIDNDIVDNLDECEFYFKELYSYLNSTDRWQAFVEILEENYFPIEIIDVFNNDIKKFTAFEKSSPIIYYFKNMKNAIFGNRGDFNGLTKVTADNKDTMCFYKTNNGKIKIKLLNKKNIKDSVKHIVEEIGDKKDNVKIMQISHAGCCFVGECNKALECLKDDSIKNYQGKDIILIPNISNVSAKDSSLEEAAKEYYEDIFHPFLQTFNDKKQKIDITLNSRCKATYFLTTLIDKINNDVNNNEMQINNLYTHFLNIPIEAFGKMNFFDKTTDKKNAYNVAKIILNDKIGNEKFRFSLPKEQSAIKDLLHQNSNVLDTIEYIISYVFDEIKRTNDKNEKIKKLLRINKCIAFDIRTINPEDININSNIITSIDLNEKDYKANMSLMRERIEKEKEMVYPELFVPKNSREKEAKEDALKAHNIALSFLKKQAIRIGQFANEQGITNEDIENYLKEEEERKENKKNEINKQSFIENNNKQANVSLNSNVNKTINL